MPESDRFDLVSNADKQLDEWEDLSQKKFQRKTGEHLIKGGAVMERVATQMVDHENRICDNELFKEKVKTLAWGAVKLLVLIALIGTAGGAIYGGFKIISKAIAG